MNPRLCRRRRVIGGEQKKVRPSFVSLFPPEEDEGGIN